MKVELSLDELCLVVSALKVTEASFRSNAAARKAGSYAALAAVQHASRLANLADRLHEETEAAEHAESLLDNME